MTRPERELLRDCSAALEYWLNQYAPDMCDRKEVDKTCRAMMEVGGTIAYIADLQQRIRKALK